MQKQTKQLDCRDSVLSATREAIDSMDKELFHLYDSETHKTLEKYGFNVSNMIQDLNEFKEDIFQLEKLHHLQAETFDKKLQENGGLIGMNSDDSDKCIGFIQKNVGTTRIIFIPLAKVFVSKNITTDCRSELQQFQEDLINGKLGQTINSETKNKFIIHLGDINDVISASKPRIT